MKLKPLEYFVVVEPREVETKTAGGLYLPDQTVEKDGFARTQGILVEISPAAFRGIEGWPDNAPIPQKGDRVAFNKYAAKEYTEDGKTYWIMRDRDVIGVIKE
jgi:chaperonin GroES